MPPLFLLRHGQTVWNREGRMQGRLDSPLTPLGQVQAARQGAILRANGAAFPARTSPRGRARTTAALAGLAPKIDDRLAEISMGDWEGTTQARHAPGVSWKFAAPGGETQAALLNRIDAFLDSLSGPTIVVTHGVILIALEAVLTGRALEDWDWMHDPQGVVLVVDAGESRILR
ncbi:histidine phosphatase family protein [Jannaschia sp. M317]|uniref:histidine phosphatase family protein n=1 Tax=Jannaschia sp. M317 TaxID=2867011 RepID=UPI0021A36D87|nr:histidine phosphatase family protein [Jannaschia sp. M317]UWQ16390.1 histidine phosphatase family protein [Jannaschia sp. M317]